ncbi:MAG: alpha-amylase family glycosyl hydrolase [Bacteroidota bacterium]
MKNSYQPISTQWSSFLLAFVGLALLGIIPSQIHAQLITAEPAFPTANDAVTITFDATEGTGGLADCGCDVYLHTGVITDASTGPADWQYVQTTWGQANAAWQLTPVPGEDNKYTYTFEPSIKEYYNVPDGEEILQLALVFRNGDGSLEGKAAGGSDIYYDVFADDIPLSLSLNAPLESNLDVALGEFITINAVTSGAATLSITEDGELLSEVTGETAISYDLRALEEGTHEVIITATDGTNTLTESFTYTAAYRVDITNPTDPVVLTSVGAMIPVDVNSYIESDLQLFVNGQEVESAMDATTISTTINVSGGSGVQEVLVAAAYEDLTDTATFVLVIPGDVPQEDPPLELPHGINYLGDGSYLLQLFAPNKDAIFVLGDFNDWQASLQYQMKQSLDGDLWWLQIDGLTEGEDYAFQYLVDGSIRIADPYSQIVLDPFNDPFIPTVTYPDLPAYPTGKTQGITSVLQPGAPEYDWQVDDFTAPAKEDLVIYELLMRDFIDRHDYETLIDTLDYLSNLGVNAIELMPVNEFEGNISWGYNPSFHMALDKYYGTINQFKAFIDECHNRGIAVILDVVYNHAFSQSPLAQLYWDQAAFKPTPENPWLNPDARHPFNVGYDFNHETAATRYFVDRVMEYWIEEFRVDGFRYDLSKGFTQTFNTDAGAWSLYDASRIAIIKHYADVVWAVNPDFYVILEHFAQNLEEVELTTYGNGMMSWSGAGLHNQYLEAAMGYGSNLSDAFYTNRGWPTPALIAYMESHDEERMMYKNEQFGNSAGDYNVRNTVTGLQRCELASAFFYTVPGPKMLWQFGELGYNFSINYCPGGGISDNCRVDPKPIRWDYFESPNRQRLYNVTKALIELKTDYPVFRTDDFASSLAGTAKRIQLNSDEMDVAVLGNFAVEPQAIPQPFQETGWWYEYFTGDSILVEDLNQSLDFVPGEYRLYTSVRLDEPPGGFISSTREVLTDAFQLEVFPNPSTEQVTISFDLEAASEVQLQLIDMNGRVMSTLTEERVPAGPYQVGATVNLPPGLYIVQLRANNQLQTRRLIVQ